MMRLTRAQFASWKLLITLLIAVDLFALWVWATRPPSIYSDWLGQVGFAAESARKSHWRRNALQTGTKKSERSASSGPPPSLIPSGGASTNGPRPTRGSLYRLGKPYRQK